MAQSIIIASVPEAEPCVGQLRARFDPAALRGLGAHITVLYPFMPPERVDRAVLGQLVMAAAATAPFLFRLPRVGRFPGTLYLAPEPAGPFVALNAMLLQRFPQLRPQGRVADALVPHLSVVRRSNADDRAVEAELVAYLTAHGPIACRCHELLLIENSTGCWRPVQAFALAAPAGAP